ncbi:MAG: rhomboid family intramembrane serine protease [Beijerinckiaceae bacterium]
MVLMPLYDIDPLEGKTRPYVTYGLIAANMLVAVGVLTQPVPVYNAIVSVFGLIPAVETRELPGGDLFPRDLTLFTSMFLHANWWHVLSNMLFLWIFGDNIEDAMGHLRFFAFYILCGLAGGAVYVVSTPHGIVPVVGASGAIAGVMAAYLMIRPCAKIEIWAFVFPYPVPALAFIGLWIATQILHVQMHSEDDVAYWVHLGGAIAGALLIIVMKQPHVRLFDCMWPSKGARESGTEISQS